MALTPPAEPAASEAKARATHLNELIGDDLCKYEIAKEDNIAEELMTLRNRIKPTDLARETEVMYDYYATLKAANRTMVEEWISKLLIILNLAKNLELPVLLIGPQVLLSVGYWGSQTL